MIEKYPLSWFVYSLGSLYALASSQSAAAAGEAGLTTEAQRHREDETDLSLLRFSVPLCPVVSHVPYRLMTLGIGPVACGQSVGL